MTDRAALAVLGLWPCASEAGAINPPWAGRAPWFLKMKNFWFSKKCTFITRLFGLLEQSSKPTLSFFFLSILVKTLNGIVFYILAESWLVFSGLNSAPKDPLTIFPPTLALGHLSPVTPPRRFPMISNPWATPLSPPPPPPFPRKQWERSAGDMEVRERRGGAKIGGRGDQSCAPSRLQRMWLSFQPRWKTHKLSLVCRGKTPTVSRRFVSRKQMPCVQLCAFSHHTVS